MIDKFLEMHTAVFKPSLPFVTGDTTLGKLFPHTGVPFQVWISPSGKVLYLADSYNLTKANIDSSLSGTNLNLRETPKNVYLETAFDSRWSSQVAFSSYLVRYNYAEGMHLDGPGKGRGVTDGGTTIYLYQRAYDELTNHKYQLFRTGRTVVEVKDPSGYFDTKHGDESITWREKHSFWYQLSVPTDYPVNVYELMKEDLDRYFRLNSRIEERMVNCLVLLRTSDKDKLKTKGGKEFDDFYIVEKRNIPTGPERYVSNVPFVRFADQVQALVENKLHKPFVDSTGYFGNIDFSIDGNVLDDIDLARLKKALQRYDLDLVEKTCPMNVLVLSDKN